MAKKIIKEVLIILLISVLIGLVLAIIFYNYVPSNKLVPSKVTAYSTPENVQKEIEDNTTEQVNKTFEITDSDLSLYKKNKSYNPGKADPFATAETTSEANNTTNNSTSNGNSANGGGDNVDRNTTDNYYNAANISTGTK